MRNHNYSEFTIFYGMVSYRVLVHIEILALCSVLSIVLDFEYIFLYDAYLMTTKVYLF